MYLNWAGKYGVCTRQLILDEQTFPRCGMMCTRNSTPEG